MPSQQFDVERGRWFVTGCSTVFALPFFVGGVALLRIGFQSLHQHRSDALGPLMGGAAFTAFSVGIVAMLWFGMRRMAATMHRRSQYASQPWLWREDWAARRIVEPGSAGGPFVLVFAIIWNAITVPMTVVLLREVHSTPALWFFVVVFPAAGIALFITAVYTMLRRHKFGRSVCSIDQVPIVPGSALRGEIEHRGSQVPEGGYDLVLQCLNRVVVGGGRNRSVTEDIVWQSAQRISGGVAAPTPVGMRVPFSFDVPADARSTDLRDATDSIVWRLVASAELPGIDYKASFELPVFETAEGERKQEVAAYHVAHFEEASRRELPAGSRITETPLPTGGTELRIAPQGHAGSMVTMAIVAAIWCGAIAMMWRMQAPFAVVVFFGLFGVVIALMAFDYVAGRSIVQADAAGLRIRREWLGAGTTVTLANGDIDSIVTKVSGRSGNRPFYEVEARLTRGSPAILARYFHSREEAETLAARVSMAMGRR